MAMLEGRYYSGDMTDRLHDAEPIAEYTRLYVDSGVRSLEDLTVSSAGADEIRVGPGIGMIEGFRVRVNGELALPVTRPASGTIACRAMIRKDSDTGKISIYIKQGTASPPELTRDGELYELSLAKFNVSATTGVNDVTDERADESLCGFCGTRDKDIRRGAGGELIFDRDITFDGAVGFGEPVDFNGTVDFDGAADFSGTVGFSGSTSFSGAISGAAFLDKTYPVGAIYISISSTSPATLFGGTWAAFGAGRVLVGRNASDTDFNTAEKTGGAKTAAFNLGGSSYARIGNANSGAHIAMAASTTTQNVSGDLRIATPGTLQWGTYTVNQVPLLGGSTETGSIVQPYVVCCMWKRTA